MSTPIHIPINNTGYFRANEPPRHGREVRGAAAYSVWHPNRPDRV